MKLPASSNHPKTLQINAQTYVKHITFTNSHATPHNASSPARVEAHHKNMRNKTQMLVERNSHLQAAGSLLGALLVCLLASLFAPE